MAERLATEYVQTCIVFTEAELSKFIQLFSEHNELLDLKVCENGSQEARFKDEADKETVFLFERKGGVYEFRNTRRLKSRNVVNALKKAIPAFKGDAIVNRIYANYTVVYYYNHGSVVKIVEVAQDQQEKLIYEYKNTRGKLETMLHSTKAEMEIQIARIEINELLDSRNDCLDNLSRQQIDDKLEQLTRRLFILEA